MVVIKMNEIGKIIFKIENCVVDCYYKKHKGCKNNSAVYYHLNGEDKHLCKKHFNEEINALNEQGIETNADEINDYFSKVEQPKNKLKGSALKQAIFNDYSSHLR